MRKNYQLSTIETLAQNALKYYDETLITGDPKEIPIEELIEFHFGLIVQYRTLNRDGAIHGIAVFEDSLIPVYDSRKKQYLQKKERY